MLLLLLIVLALLFLGAGFGTRGHEQYGSYSGPVLVWGGCCWWYS